MPARSVNLAPLAAPLPCPAGTPVGGGRINVRWTGFTIHDRFGNPCNAQYEATLSRDGRRLFNGSWRGGAPGTWSAEFNGDL